MRSWPRGLAGTAGALLLAAAPAAGQAHAGHGGHAGGAAVTWSAGAQAIPLVTHSAPAVYGESRTEGSLAQTMAMGHLAWRGLELRGMLNLEGLTLPDGEPNTGIWGEGFVDRRHPHTYLHELVATARVEGPGGLAASLSAGRGFVPFGTDDPMARPVVKYPLNHHYAQLLERLVATAALRAGSVAVEAAAFNGDEPTGPEDLGNAGRFGDSWAARITAWPLAGLELQASHARLRSPETREAVGPDQRKWSASARWEGAGGLPYALVEWARSTDYDDGRAGHHFHSALAEAAVPLPRGTRLALRLERTERPEEERLEDPFRLAPHVGAHVLGITRWDVATLQLAGELPRLGPLQARPFAEVAHLRPREVMRPSFFEPGEFYGSDRLWTLAVGARLAVGATHPRAGRYGAAQPPSPAPDTTPHP